MSNYQQERGAYTVSASFAKEVKDIIVKDHENKLSALFIASKMAKDFVNAMPKADREVLLNKGRLFQDVSVHCGYGLSDFVGVFLSAVYEFNKKSIRTEDLITAAKKFALLGKEKSKQKEKARKQRNQKTPAKNAIPFPSEMDLNSFIEHELNINTGFRRELNHYTFDNLFGNSVGNAVIESLKGNGRLNAPKVSVFNQEKFKRGSKKIGFTHAELDFILDLDKKSIFYEINENNHSVDDAYECDLFKRLLKMMEQAGPRGCRGSARYYDEYMRDEMVNPNDVNVFGETSKDENRRMEMMRLSIGL